MSDSVQAFLDSGTSFEGKVVFSGVVRIDGHFRGEASSTGTLVIGETGTVEAELELASLVVKGTFRGSVTARDQVDVGESGIVEGRLKAGRIRVAEGARLNATIEVKSTT